MSSLDGFVMLQRGCSGRRARRAVFLYMCGMVIISAAQLGMAIYLLLAKMKETLLIATESFMIYAVSHALLCRDAAADSD
jgi:hypothetical protein